jgi:hypothetical protein
MMKSSWRDQMGGRKSGCPLAERARRGGMSSMHAIRETR